MNEQPRDILTPEQAAEYLQVNRKTIYRYIRCGKLRAVKVGRSCKVSRRSLNVLLSAMNTPGDVTLREYTAAEIDRFLEADRL